MNSPDPLFGKEGEVKETLCENGEFLK